VKETREGKGRLDKKGEGEETRRGNKEENKIFRILTRLDTSKVCERDERGKRERRQEGGIRKRIRYFVFLQDWILLKYVIETREGKGRGDKKGGE
jgi:hypothetical protein